METKKQKLAAILITFMLASLVGYADNSSK